LLHSVSLVPGGWTLIHHAAAMRYIYASGGIGMSSLLIQSVTPKYVLDFSNTVVISVVAQVIVVVLP
jgi:hypothetical protein